MNPWQGLTKAPVVLAPYKPPKPRTVRLGYLSDRASNPWGLTTAQMEVLDLLTQTGENKAVARKRGVALKTIEDHVMQLVRTMGVENRTLAVLTYDRWKRSDK